MRTLFLSLFLSLSLSLNAWAAPTTIHVTINGLVCDFCARSLEKVFGKRDEVAGINVNLDSKIVTITLKDNSSMDDALITTLITDAGYTVEAIHHD